MSFPNWYKINTLFFISNFNISINFAHFNLKLSIHHGHYNRNYELPNHIAYIAIKQMSTINHIKPAPNTSTTATAALTPALPTHIQAFFLFYWSMTGLKKILTQGKTLQFRLTTPHHFHPNLPHSTIISRCEQFLHAAHIHRANPFTCHIASHIYLFVLRLPSTTAAVDVYNKLLSKMLFP